MDEIATYKKELLADCVVPFSSTEGFSVFQFIVLFYGHNFAVWVQLRFQHNVVFSLKALINPLCTTFPAPSNRQTK